MPNRPKVNILLSTYNGEKYLTTQLDSILAQTYENITIYVRDDGSQDNTSAILESYKKKYASLPNRNFIIMKNHDNKNLGYMESFWTLLRDAEPADYYAFCDQDDYWLPEKTERGVEALENEDTSVPLLYSSSFIYCDENMDFIGNPIELQLPIRFSDVLFYTPAFGFTVMINHTLRKVALSALSLKEIPHDGWCQKIAASMGKIIYDSVQTAKYRRHSATVTYARLNKIQLVYRWWKNDIMGRGLTENHMVLRRFYEEYAKYLDEETLAYLHIFMEQPVAGKLYFQRLFFPKRLRPSLGGELALRICFLLNK